MGHLDEANLKDGTPMCRVHLKDLQKPATQQRKLSVCVADPSVFTTSCPLNIFKG